jgi:hypothetical protein
MLLGPISIILAKYIITYFLDGKTFKEYIDHVPSVDKADG